jgi:hypothetical protein
MSSDDHQEIAEFLKQCLGRKVSELGPKGLPQVTHNTDHTDEGAYGMESLTDPGWVNIIAGTGHGRVIR